MNTSHDGEGRGAQIKGTSATEGIVYGVFKDAVVTKGVVYGVFNFILYMSKK